MEIEAVGDLISIVSNVVNMFREMLKAKAKGKDIRITEERLRQLEEKVAALENQGAQLELQAATFDSTAQEIISDFEDLGGYDKALARLYYEQEIDPKGPLMRVRALVNRSLREKLEESHRKENFASLNQEKEGKA